jgi:pseudaminic acid biosynthesis-associated methylase
MESVMQMSSQLQLWVSEFGRSYTERNDVAKPERILSWQRLLEGIAPERAVEVGCNVAWNLTYLRELGVKELYAVEPQPFAVEKARARNPEYNVLCGTAFDLPFKDNFADLVFTSGVMIHIAPADLPKAMAEIYRVSRRYIVAIEYDAAEEQEIKYRGNGDALWKRPHGAIWQASYPALKLLRKLELAPIDGYDDCTAHLFEKTT